MNRNEVFNKFLKSVCKSQAQFEAVCALHNEFFGDIMMECGNTPLEEGADDCECDENGNCQCNPDFECGDEQFESDDEQFESGDELFECGDEQFECGDEQFEAGDEQFECGDEQFECGDEQFEASDDTPEYENNSNTYGNYPLKEPIFGDGSECDEDNCVTEAINTLGLKMSPEEIVEKAKILGISTDEYIDAATEFNDM